MVIGGALGQRKFPVSSEGVLFSRIGGPGKAAQILEEGNGTLRKEREREQDGVGDARRARSVLGAHPNPSQGTKMLGKMLLTKKAYEKSLTSKNKV
jgi:hypothetical protein